MLFAGEGFGTVGGGVGRRRDGRLFRHFFGLELGVGLGFGIWLGIWFRFEFGLGIWISIWIWLELRFVGSGRTGILRVD